MLFIEFFIKQDQWFRLGPSKQPKERDFRQIIDMHPIFKQIFNTEINCFLQRNAGKDWLYIKASHYKFRIETLKFFCKYEGIIVCSEGINSVLIHC